MRPQQCLFTAVVVLLVVIAAGAGVTHSTGDRIMNSMSAAAGAIDSMVSEGGRNGRVATNKGVAYAKLATQRAADPWQFGGKRKLLAGVTYETGDRIMGAMSATRDSIASMVADGGRNTRVAANKGVAYAKLATQRAADPWQFGGNRKLLAGVTAETGDRIMGAMGATRDAIASMVSEGGRNSRAAANKGVAYAKLATQRAADPWQFGGNRKLQEQGYTADSTDDRITNSMSAVREAIQAATTRTQAASTAANKGMAYAKLATQRAADASSFGGNRKLQEQGYTADSTDDRITNSMSAVREAIQAATTRTQAASTAANKGMVYAKLATQRAADASSFGGNRKLQEQGYTADSTDDRITNSMSAVREAIQAATTRTQAASTAANKGVAYAKLATQRAVDASQFGGNKH